MEALRGWKTVEDRRETLVRPRRYNGTLFETRFCHSNSSEMSQQRHVIMCSHQFRDGGPSESARSQARAFGDHAHAGGRAAVERSLKRGKAGRTNNEAYRASLTEPFS